MPVSRNKRKKPKRKRKKKPSAIAGDSSHEEGASGALMGLRSGFKKAVGSDTKKSKSQVGKILNWAFIVAAAGLIIFFIYQMVTN